MKKNTSVLIVIERFFPLKGGAETQSWQLAEYLSKRKKKVFVVTKRWKKEFPSQEKFKEEFRVFRLGIPGSGRIAEYLAGLNLLIFMIKKRNFYDLVYVNGGLANVFGSTAILVGKILRKKVVARVATPGELFFKGPLSLSPKKFIHPLIKIRLKIVKLADIFIAQTKQIKKEVLIFGVPSKKIKIIPDGIETNLFYPPSLKEKRELRRKLNLPLDKIIVAYCGRLVKRKGLINLFESWETVIKKTNKAVLLVVGSGKNQPDSIEEILKEKIKNDMKGKIFLVGEKNKLEVSNYLKTSDIFVYPSLLSEGTPFSLLEAMACGLAVVGSNVGGINEVITPKKTGILFSKGNSKELFLKTLELINNSSLRKKLGENAYREIKNKYEISLIMDKFYQLFKRILNFNF